MEISSVNNSFGTAKQIILLILAAGLWAFIIYIRWLAAPEQLLFIGTAGLDKVAHTAGGMFLAVFSEWRLKRMTLRRLIAFLLIMTSGWEVLEFLFDADTQFFYANAFDLWFLDSSGDVIAGFLGGYGWWVFGAAKNDRESDSRPFI